ncbi:MAG: hypothetical protein ACOC8P_00400 [Dichotomicrobium sp.]
MDPSIRPIDTRHEAIKAMAGALADLGFTRGGEQPEPPDVIAASSAALAKLRDVQDFSFAFEFIAEGSIFSDSRLINALAEYMAHPTDKAARAIADELTSRARIYGESFIDEALDMLDSASEIERDRKVDQDIKQMKESA